MNLYLIRRTHDPFIKDTFAFAVVAAKSGKAAKHIHPARGVTWSRTMWIKGGKEYGFDLWTHPSHLRATLLGRATIGTAAGTMCTAFS